MRLGGFSLRNFPRPLSEMGSPPRLQNICRKSLYRASAHIFMSRGVRTGGFLSRSCRREICCSCPPYLRRARGGKQAAAAVSGGETAGVKLRAVQSGGPLAALCLTTSQPEGGWTLGCWTVSTRQVVSRS